MAIMRKLVNKLMRREKYVVKHARGNFDRRDKREEVLQASPGAYKAMRHPQRRYDRNFGYDAVGIEPRLHYLAPCTIERFDFDPGAGTDYGIKLTLSAALIEASGIQPGDTVEFLQDSALYGQYLKVVSLPDATSIRLEDVASFAGPESNKTVRLLLSTIKKSYY